jgi:hypothetical protein
MLDQGGAFSREASDPKLDHDASDFRQYGYCRWTVESRDDEFVGYADVYALP